MTDYMERKEIQEAITAGERALGSLRTASDYLDSARNWGIVDMFGGGTFSGILKHSKLNDAQMHLEAARNQMRIFEKELKDVTAIDGLYIETGDFLTFADLFLDGFLADYLVQSRINETRARVTDAIRRTEGVLSRLRTKLMS